MSESSEKKPEDGNGEGVGTGRPAVGSPADGGPEWMVDPAPLSEKSEEPSAPEDDDLPPAREAETLGHLEDPAVIHRRNLIRYVLAGLILVLALASGSLLFVYLHMSRGLPKLDALSSYRPYLSVEIEDRNGSVIWEIWKERRKLVPYEQIPRRVINAFQAAEDSSFFEHGGIDIWAIARAAIKNFLAGGVKQGASTITQQVAKTFLLSNERSIERKIKEAILAYRIERNFSKEEILYLYLNQIFLGNGSYGVKVAAETYFHKDLDELTLAEAAMLAGLPKAPTNLNPIVNYKGAIERQRYVLQQMLDNRMITREEFTESLSEEVRVYPQPKFHSDYPHLSYAMEEVRLDLIARLGEERLFTSGLRVRTTIDNEMQKHAYGALRAGIERADKMSGWRGPLRKVARNALQGELTAVGAANGLGSGIVPERSGKYQAVVLAVGMIKRTTDRMKGVPEKGVLVGLSPELTGVVTLAEMDWAIPHNPIVGPIGKKITDPGQALSPGDVVSVRMVDAEQAQLEFANRPEEFQKPNLQLSLEQEPEIQAAIVVVDPFTGDIRAEVGGYSFEKSSFNRVSQALRQPGSAFKPFIYSLAIENGYTQVTKVFDTAVVLPGARQEEYWMPKNHDDAFLGEITLRRALALSVNTIAVKLALDEKVGVASAREFVAKFGFQSEMPKDYTIALGTAPVTPLEMARAFSMFPNGGYRVSGRLAVEGTDGTGENLFREQSRYVGKPEAAGSGASRLISPQAAYIMTSMLGAVITEGTGGRAAAYGRPAGGKTGTSSDSRDAWFIGFNPGLVCAVWFGFDDNRSLGRAASGGLLAAPTWLDFMQRVSASAEPEDFAVPDDIIFVRIDPRTGRRIPDPLVDDYYSGGGSGPPPTESKGAKAISLEGKLVPFIRGTEPVREEAPQLSAKGSQSLYEGLEPDEEQSPGDVQTGTGEEEIPKD